MNNHWTVQVLVQCLILCNTTVDTPGRSWRHTEQRFLPTKRSTGHFLFLQKLLKLFFYRNSMDIIKHMFIPCLLNTHICVSVMVCVNSIALKGSPAVTSAGCIWYCTVFTYNDMLPGLAPELLQQSVNIYMFGAFSKSFIFADTHHI